MKDFFLDIGSDRRVFRLIFPLLLSLISFSPDIAAQSIGTESSATDRYTSAGKRIYETVMLQANPPKIDGQLNDPCWEEGIWSGNYRKYLPAENAEPSQKTQLKILYDNQYIITETNPEGSTYAIGNPDFNFRQYRSNFALVGNINPDPLFTLSGRTVGRDRTMYRICPSLKA